MKILKAAQKALKKGAKAAKLKFSAATLDGAGNGGVGTYWEAVRALNSGDGPATRAVVAQQFYDEDGNVCETPGENAMAAAAHFTKVYKTSRERPEGTQAALDEVQQREVRVDLDSIIMPEDLGAVLVKAKKSKATSNGVVIIELLEACLVSPKSFRRLHKPVSGIFRRLPGPC